MEGPQDLPEAIAGPIEEATIRLLQPELLPSYSEEKRRHKEAKMNNDLNCKAARNVLRRLFGPVRERIEGKIEGRHDALVREEDAGQRWFLDGVREAIRAGGQSQAS